MNDATTHKRWWKEATDNFAPLPAYKAAYFAREFRPLRLKPDARILDVGFGDGELMNFSRERGYAIEGVEINENQLRAAREAGFSVYPALKDTGHYDLICLFDVLEHVEADDLPGFLASVRDRLNDGGQILIRVPNGQSPFGLVYQHGNITHVTPIGGMMIEQLASLTGLEVVGVRNQAMILHSNPIKAAVLLLQWPLGRLAEILIAAAFFPKVHPLHPNLVGHLRKPTHG